MFLRELKNPLCGVRGISERKAGNLAKLGIISVAELLTRYPKDYEDRTELVCLRDYNKQRNVNTIIKVIDHKSFLFRGETKWKIIIEDQTARAVLPCFFRGNFLVQKMAIGSEFRISGRFEKNKYGELQSTHFEIEGIEDAEDIDTLLPQTSKFGKILPIYYYSDAERNRLLRATINDTLVQYAKHIENELPEHIIEGEKCISSVSYDDIFQNRTGSCQKNIDL